MLPLQNLPVSEEPKTQGWLAQECGCVQGNLLELAAALKTGALPEFAGLVPSYLSAIRELRGKLREHVMSVEGPAGIFDYMAAGAPDLMSELDHLSEDHFAMDACLADLERQLQAFRPPDPPAAAKIREAAERLATLTQCHQDSACRLVRRAGEADGSESH